MREVSGWLEKMDWTGVPEAVEMKIDIVTLSDLARSALLLASYVTSVYFLGRGKLLLSFIFSGVIPVIVFSLWKIPRENKIINFVFLFVLCIILVYAIISEYQRLY